MMPTMLGSPRIYFSPEIKNRPHRTPYNGMRCCGATPGGHPFAKNKSLTASFVLVVLGSRACRRPWDM